MSFIDLFIRPEEGDKKTPQTNEVKNPQKKETSEVKTTVPPTTPTTPAPTVEFVPSENDNEVSLNIQRQVWKTLVDRNIPGPDMMELKTYSTSLESMGLSLEKRYEAAFKMLKAQYPDFTKESLLKSVDTYISFVNEELANGQKQLAEKKKQEIGNKKQSVERLKNEGEEVLKKIEELKKKYDEINEKITKSSAEIAASETKIMHDEQVFVEAIKSVISSLTNDRNTMSNLNID